MPASAVAVSAGSPADGKAARALVARADHAAWEPASGRPDPVAVLERQAAGRVAELVPIRYGRMLSSPFAFFRGAAAIMAGDLAGTPSTGFAVQLCGDAHLSNFGGFASPERRLVFSVNDFDETLPGPWEWDVKRLAASVEVAGRERGGTSAERRRAVLSTVRAYRRAMRSLAAMTNLEVWYAQFDAAEIVTTFGARADARLRTRFTRNVAKAQTKDSMRALRKLTARVDGRLRIVGDPPLVVPVEDLAPGPGPAAALEEQARALLRRYRSNLRSDRRRLLDGYRYEHLARKVVGVGSVGLRAWIVLLTGRDDADPLFLQVKEAGPSVLEPYAGASRHDNHGRRVVEGQRLTQASSDIFLGWLRATDDDGVRHDYYVRQLWDWKLSSDVAAMTADDLALYGRLCGSTLARAHARSGDRVAIAAYLGGGTPFDEALAEFAGTYADQSERDYAALQEAAGRGRLQVQTGV